MADYIHDPSLLSHTNGFALANGASTGAAAGWTLSAVTSSGGSITYHNGGWRSVGNAGVARLDGAVTPTSTLGVEILFNRLALPTGAANRLIEPRTASAQVCRLEENTNGTITLLNAANTAVWTSTAIPVGPVRIFLGVATGADTASGQAVVHIYANSPYTSTTPSQSFALTTGNYGTGTIETARFGRISSTAASTADVVTEYVLARDSLTPIGPKEANVPPTVVYTTDGPYVEFDARTSQPGTSTSLAYSIAHVSGPNNLTGVREPVDGWFFVPQDTASAVYAVTATGDDGISTENVTVPAAEVAISSGIRRRRWNGTELVG